MGHPLVLTLRSKAGSLIFSSFGDGVFMVVILPRTTIGEVGVSDLILMLHNFFVLISLQETGICTLYLHFGENNCKFLGICYKNSSPCLLPALLFSDISAMMIIYMYSTFCILFLQPECHRFTLFVCLL